MHRSQAGRPAPTARQAAGNGRGDGEAVRTAPTRRQVLSGSVPALAAFGGCLGLSAPTADGSESLEVPPTVSGSVDARLAFAGDAMLGRSVDERWRDAEDPAGVWGSLAGPLRALDGFVLNLECCLSTRGERWPDKTYYFRADPGWAVPALAAAGTTWVSLANNHAMDFGPTALRDTRRALSAAEIGHGGAGPDREAALAPSVQPAGPLEVALIGLSGRWSEYRAGEDEPGTAYLPLDVGRQETRRTVRRLLDQVREVDPDLVVASLHWGPNWEAYPGPTRRELGRWLVEQGVDLVHGHSAHVVQGVEIHRGRPILYDTGDVVDDYAVKPDLRNDRSFLFVLEVADGRFEAVRLHPIEIDEYAVRPASAAAVSWLHDEMAARCEPFGTTLQRDGDDLVIPLGE
jgi:poly-gamma-glutamate capsule biosynthesis protein CapA/YwtB (metallophosphatase superfamily)